MSEQPEVTSDTKQPDPPVKSTPGHGRQRKPSSLRTTVSLLLRLKDPTHRERGAWVQARPQSPPLLEFRHVNLSFGVPQEQAGRYSVQQSTAADPHHVLMVYKGSRYTANLQGILGNPDGPTEVISWRWGWSPVRFAYNVWIFKEGSFELQSDGGVINWYWESPSAERTEKSVEFHKLG